MLLFALGALAADPVREKTVPAFTNLQHAVNFLATCLDRQDFQKLADSYLTTNQAAEKSVLAQLKTIHDKTHLPKLYAARQFPTDSAQYTLGGHASELGYIHIDFVKTGTVWRLDRIWLCR